MLIFFSFIIFGVYTMAFVSLITTNANKLIDGLTEYFACEASGHVPGKCSREVFEKYSYPYVAMVAYLLQGIVPITHLNYVLDWRAMWNTKCLNCQTVRAICSKKFLYKHEISSSEPSKSAPTSSTSTNTTSVL